MNENIDVNINVQDETKLVQIKSVLKNETRDQETKKSVKFNKVEVYSFERCQGYLSIPASDNDSSSITLGMRYFHNEYESFISQDEFLKFKRKIDLDKIKKFLNLIEKGEITALNDDIIERAKEILSKRDFYEENIEQDLAISADILCPILSLEQRMEKLANLGYSREEIDSKESEDINLIRESRLVCGCICSKLNMVCGESGDLCSCFANGINCQIDRVKFPCSCNLKRCKNLYGMKRFNPKTVFDHYKKVLYGKNVESEDTPRKKGRKRKNTSNMRLSKRKKINNEQINLDDD